MPISIKMTATPNRQASIPRPGATLPGLKGGQAPLVTSPDVQEESLSLSSFAGGERPNEVRLKRGWIGMDCGKQPWSMLAPSGARVVRVGCARQVGEVLAFADMTKSGLFLQDRMDAEMEAAYATAEQQRLLQASNSIRWAARASPAASLSVLSVAVIPPGWALLLHGVPALIINLLRDGCAMQTGSRPGHGGPTPPRASAVLNRQPETRQAQAT